VFQRFTAVLTCVLLLTSLAGCIRPHKSPISQGNLLRVEDIERLETGMTREQVVFLIGQPILAQPFEKSRWDYVYVSRQGYKEPARKNITLFFEDDRLARIENNYLGAGPENLSEKPTELEEAEEIGEE
jgi:outer membrane protein assembly factor BamE